MHGRAGPVDFRSFTGLVFKMVGEPVGDGEIGITFVELGLAHWDLAVTLAAFDVFLMEKFESDAYPFQFLMHVFVIRIAVQGLVRELLWVEEAVDRRFLKSADIVVANALLVSDVENLTDGMP